MSTTAETTRTGRRYQRLLPVAGLLVLAPFCAEYLIGAISIRALPALPFLIPLYGAAALLIREISRRTGRGWPTMLLLGAAFGVFEAGVVDASLFNSNYEGLELGGAEVPILHFSAVFGLNFVMNHVMLSIGAPIALVEALEPGDETAPWLGRGGLAVTAVCYLGGSTLIGWDNWVHEHFYPSALQLSCAAVTVAVLIALAFICPRQPRPGTAPAPRPLPPPGAQPSVIPAPSPLRVGLFIAAATGAYFFAPGNWAGLAVGVLLIAFTGERIVRWSGRSGWDSRHRITVAAGALSTGAWGAWFVGSFTGQTDTVTRLGNLVFALAAAVLVWWTARRSRSREQTRSRP